MRFLVATFLAAQISGCSSQGDATPGSASPAVPSTPSTEPACKLLTKEEAAALLGHAVKPGEPRMTGPVPSCRFKSDGAAGSVSVQYYSRGTENVAPIRAMMMKDAVEIGGAGTTALRNADGSLLLVLANGHLGFVTAIAMGKNGGPTAAAAEAFAPVLASRL